MILPFLAVFTKPFFCALADRHRRYRLYFILALLFTLIGFGSYTFLPFFPEFIANHGRAAWYMLVVFTVIGYIAYGVVWSLGDAYAANVSHKTGESFGLIRLWGTIGWGVAGAVVGSVSPYVQLPEMVLGFIIFIITHVFEIILLCWWPRNEDFEMGDAIPSHGPESLALPAPQPDDYDDGSTFNKFATMTEKSPAGTLTARSLASHPSPTIDDNIVLALSQLKSGELSITRTPSNSLAIVTKVKLANENETQKQKMDALDKTIGDLVERTKRAPLKQVADLEADKRERDRQRISQLQMTIFKMVAMKHKSLIKYLIIFVLLGTVYNIHWSYFFLHLDQLAAEGKGGDFSTLVGMCLVAQAVGETFCFAIAPWVVSKLGRDGAISLNAIAYAVRYFGNGLGIPMVSPYVAVLTESLQGINYGIFYYLITDTALHYALLVDEIIPDLQSRELIEKDTDLNLVRTSLRATMQGVFSGAFDGLGFGLGSMIAGLVLESHAYEELWCYTGAAAFVIFLSHAIYEIINKTIRRHLRQKQADCALGSAYGRTKGDNFCSSNEDPVKV